MNIISSTPKKQNLASRRPAETATGLAASIVAILAIVGVDVSDQAVIAIIAGIGAIPAVVTAIVERVRAL